MGRVVLLIRRYCPGEAWTNRILAYAKGFSELGAEVVIYYLISDKSRTSYQISIPNVTIVNLWEKDGFVSKKYRHLSFIKNYYLFFREIRKGDRIFFSGFHNYQFWIVKLFNKRAQMFCESTEHPDVFVKHSENYNKKLKQVLNKHKALFVISKSLKDYYISIGVDSERIHVINMFVDTGRFRNLKKTTDEKYIAYCGAVSYDKDGVNILIESFSKFYPKHNDYKLYIIGKGVDQTVINRLKELTRHLEVEQSVVFTGPVSPQEMPQLLYNAQILALARPDSLQAQNGFPTKLGEYLATGNPVVVTRVGEIPLFIKHKENGFLADPNSDSFSEQLSWVADNYDAASEIGRKGRELAYNEFSYLSQSKKALTVMNS